MEMNVSIVMDKDKNDSSQFTFLANGSEMSELIRAHDWAQTALGAMESWPAALLSTLSICLSARFPMAIYWGAEGFLLYNDAWRPILGNKHPWALGRGARDVWPEIWSTINPLFETVRATGQATWRPDELLPMHRFGYREECYFDYSFNPITGQTKTIEGILNIVQETTFRVLNERRTHLLSELAARSATAKTEAEACRLAMNAIATDPADVPFAFLCNAEPDGNFRVIASTGFAGNVPVQFPDHDGSIFGKIKSKTELIILKNFIGQFGLSPSGFWPEPVTQAVLLPIVPASENQMAVVLIAGVSPRRHLDEAYTRFFELIASHVASTLANAKTFEEERKRALALAELDRAKTTFFSNVSHELRTPLTLILGPLEDELRERGGANPRLQLAHRNSLRLLKLVNTLLDFSRIEAGRIEATLVATDLAAFTAELAAVFRSGVERAGLRLVVDCARVAEPVYVDRDMWEKIVFNLLSNAFKFTFEGEIEIKLQVAPNAVAVPADEKVETGTSTLPCACLSVRDTGTGIPAAELPRIFERFHRVHNARSRSHEGTGIGLALVQELARQHGGGVGVESSEGKGTTFTVWLPLGHAHLPRERIGAAGSLASTHSGALPFVEETLRWLPEIPESFADHDGKGDAVISKDPAGKIFRDGANRRILLADDNADMREYMRRLLVARGHDVIAVENGEAALAAVRAEPPALVLSDVMMPRLDGFGLLREMRNDPRTNTIPIILISARAGEESRVEGVEAGADDYLTKPFSARELLARVSTHLDLARRRRETEEKIRATLESITDGLHVVDAAGRFIYLNAEARRMMAENGLVPEAMIGREYFELFPENYHQPIGEAFRQCLHEHVRKETENYYPPWQRWFNVRHYPRAEGGVSTFFQDITERKRAEAVMLAGQRRFRQLADTMPQMVWITKPDGAHEYFNKRWYEFTGMPEGSLGGPGWAELFHPEDDQRVRAHWKKSLATGALYEIEYRLKSRAGDYCWFLCRALPVRDEAGRIINWFGTCTDIEGVKRVEEALRHANASAESANRSKDHFLAALSHELRTPLTPVLITAATLQEDERLPAEVRGQLAMMERNIALEARLIDDLLDISAISTGKLHLHSQLCDTHSLIRLALEMVQDAALTKEIKLVCELRATRSSVLTDPARFQQIVWNLVRNAVKFTSPGGQVAIRTTERAAGNTFWLCLEVTDTGIGIAPELLEKIFRPFEQGAVTGDHRFGGMGLGLAIARAIVELHGGKISAHSPGINHGATFVVELPGAVVPPPSPSDDGNTATSFTKFERSKTGTAPTTGNAPRILLVEDHASTLQVLSTLLRRDGYEVLPATNVAEALAQVAAQPCELVISDLGLPDGSGIQLMRQLRTNYGLRGIALTGYGMEEDIARAREAGFAAHLVKPIQVAELRRILADLSLSRA